MASVIFLCRFVLGFWGVGLASCDTCYQRFRWGNRLLVVILARFGKLGLAFVLGAEEGVQGLAARQLRLPLVSHEQV